MQKKIAVSYYFGGDEGLNLNAEGFENLYESMVHVRLGEEEKQFKIPPLSADSKYCHQYFVALSKGDNGETQRTILKHFFLLLKQSSTPLLLPSTATDRTPISPRRILSITATLNLIDDELRHETRAQIYRGNKIATFITQGSLTHTNKVPLALTPHASIGSDTDWDVSSVSDVDTEEFSESENK